MTYTLPGLETDQAKLQALLDFLSEVADNYGQIRALGGAAMPGLYELAQNKKALLRPVIRQLMMDIAVDSTAQLQAQNQAQVCPHCWMLGVRHKVSLSWRKSLSYFGCRHCHQNLEFLQGELVAVLDRGWTETYVETDDLIAVNWLKHRWMFDFTSVLIKAATDEEVERFAVQIGNDTDERRKSHYNQLRCLLSPDAPLSENSKRILQRTFGEVVIKL